MNQQRRLAAILAADVVGYSRLMGEDEEGTLASLTLYLNDTVDPCVAEYRGRIFKSMGDGLLAEFASVIDAVRCAAAIQHAIEERNAEVPQHRRIQFRIGINLGDVIIKGDDIFGDGVNVAARLESLADAGGICISDIVHQSIRSKVDLSFDDLGPQRVKNIGPPVHAFKVRRDAPMTQKSGSEGTHPLPEKPSIAVLPFDNLSGDPDQEYFSDGITEDIITELAKISGLFVIARHSSFIYKGRSVTLMQVGRDLGVRYVLEGSVRKAQNRLRITAQLIDATSDHHVWAERYDRDLEDIFAVQDDVARQVAGALAVTLKPGEAEQLAHAPTQIPEAYDLYLRARMTFYPPTWANILTARGTYGHVIDIDPSFAGGYAGKSITHSMAVMFGHSDNPEQDVRLALEFAEQAVTKDDAFALSHSALGYAYSVARQDNEAIAAARRAVELQPGDADSYLFLTNCLLRAGQGEEARDSILTGLRLNPQNVAGPYLNSLGRACFVAGRYQEASDTFERNVAHGGPLGVPMLSTWVTSLVELGRFDDARKIAQRLVEFDPGFSLTRAGNDAFGLSSETYRDRIIEALRKVGVPE